MGRRACFFACVLSIGCGKDGGGDDSGGSTSGDPFTSGHSHSSSDPSAVSLTFTNTSDDPSSDPTRDPSSDPSSDPTSLTSVDPSSETGSSTGETGDSSGPADSSSGAPQESSSSDGGTSGGACCEVQDGAGCGDEAIEACVCARESFCCDVEWDLYCTVQVVLLGCDECPGIGGDGDCCAAHDNPGCDDDMIEACVCEMDLACCTEGWDDLCVEQVSGRCGSC